MSSFCGAFMFTLLFFFEYVKVEKLGYQQNISLRVASVVVLTFSLLFIILGFTQEKPLDEETLDEQLSETSNMFLFFFGLVLAWSCYIVQFKDNFTRSLPMGFIFSWIQFFFMFSENAVVNCIR